MRKALIPLCAILCVLTCAVAAFAGETASVIGDIPEKELAAYVEVTRVPAGNPSLSKEENDSLPAKNRLTREKDDAINRRVQSDPEMKKKVEEADAHKTTALEEFKKIPGMRTKLKKAVKPAVK